MGFAEAVSSGFRNYVNFRDRAPRSEYWYWFLFAFLAYALAAFVDGIVGTVGIFYFVTALGLILPNLAVFVRRMHDIDRSGWSFLWGLIPILGNLYVLYLLVRPGTAGSNRYGSELSPPI